MWPFLYFNEGKHHEPTLDRELPYNTPPSATGAALRCVGEQQSLLIFNTKHVLGWKPARLSYPRCTCRPP